MYVSRYAESSANAPRVPKVLHFFRGGEGMGYVVTDHINSTLPPAPERVAGALKWFREVPIPRDYVGVGPLGNGLARHKLFKDSTAPFPFSGIEALRLYLNKVRVCLYFFEHSPSANTYHGLGSHETPPRVQATSARHPQL
jgi:hypothetical protein